MKNRHVMKKFHDTNDSAMRRFCDLQLQLNGDRVPDGIHIGAREATSWISLTHGNRWSF
jgi:hypothetical protein